MASDSPVPDRTAALRRLLVERADADGRLRERTAGRGARGPASPAAPGRLRLAAVTGVVLVAVVAGSIAALNAVHVAPSGTGPAESMPVPTQSASPTPTPTPTAAVPLVAKRDARVRTRAQLHAFVQADSSLRGNTIWEEQAWLRIGCMAKAGFLYDPVTETVGDDGGLTRAQKAAFEVAMDGPKSDKPYDWKTAGCYGRAVHETGQDDAD